MITFLGDSENIFSWGLREHYLYKASNRRKISSKGNAIGLVFYESTPKTVHMITFLGDSENIDFFPSGLHEHYLYKARKSRKISSKANAMGLVFYESTPKTVHMITFLGDSENSEMFWNNLECLRMIWNGLEWFRNSMECFGMILNVLKWLGIFRNGLKCFEIIWNV